MCFSSRIQHTAKWRQCIDKEGVGRLSGALLTDLSKALDCLLHDFSTNFLFLCKATSLKGNKETKLITLAALSLTNYMVFHKGFSILGQLRFNIYISDIFHDIDNCGISSYADSNTLCTSDCNLEEVIQKTKLITNNLFEWFKSNYRKVNADKCQLLVTRDIDITAKIGEFDVKNSKEEKCHGFKIDPKISFENHVSSLCIKAIQIIICTRTGREILWIQQNVRV